MDWKDAEEVVEKCEDTIKTAEPSIEILATMDWREAAVIAEYLCVIECDELQSKLNLYTRALALLYTLKDIDVLYNEAEFRKKLKVMKESYFEADESIQFLLPTFLYLKSPKHPKSQELQDSRP